MSFRLDYIDDDKVLFNDNIAVKTTKDQMDFFRVFITDHSASVGRYCVPGRLDVYSFDYIPGSCGIGERVAYFSDEYDQTLIKGVSLLKRDLKKKRVKELIAQALAKVPRSYFNMLLDKLK